MNERRQQMLHLPHLAHQGLTRSHELTHFKINHNNRLVWSNKDILRSNISVKDSSRVYLFERFDDVATYLGGVLDLV
jgi:hypothetical protein